MCFFTCYLKYKQCGNRIVKGGRYLTVAYTFIFGKTPALFKCTLFNFFKNIVGAVPFPGALMVTFYSS